MSKGKYTYDYPRPMFTTDAVVTAVRNKRLEVLVVLRKNEPFAGKWALPGGFIDGDETLEATVARELDEETGLTGIRFSQLHTFGDPDRDPRARSISTAYLALVDAAKFEPHAGDDAGDVKWLDVADARGLAFDHDKIVQCAVARLRMFTRFAGVGEQSLPERFPLDALLQLYEAIECGLLMPDAFAARIEALGVVEPAGEGLYRFVLDRLAPV